MRLKQKLDNINRLEQLNDKTFERLTKLQKRFPNSAAWNKEEVCWRKMLVESWDGYDQENDMACEDCLYSIGAGQICFCNCSYG